MYLGSTNGNIYDSRIAIAGLPLFEKKFLG